MKKGQKLLILEDLDTSNTNIGFRKRSDQGKYVKSRFEVFDTSAIYCQLRKNKKGQKLLILEDLDARNTNIGFKKRSDHGKYVKSRFEVFDTSAIY